MGKHSKQRSRLFRKRNIVIAALLVICISIFSGTTLAYLVAGTDPITALFAPGQVSCEVQNAAGNTTSQKASVKNTGSTTAYIRAAVVVNWVNTEGVVRANHPEEGVDYNITFAQDSGWEKGADGFWYYTSPVNAGDTTAELIESCSRIKSKAPTGYTLSIEVIASAVQATPTSAVTEAWDSGVASVDSTNNLVLKEVQNP